MSLSLLDDLNLFPKNYNGVCLLKFFKEVGYLSRLYEMNFLLNTSIVEHLTNRILQLEQKITELDQNSI